MRAIILSAGKSERMDTNIPKTLLKVGSATILERTINILKWCGIDDIALVIGDRGECWNDLSKRKIRDIAEANRIKLVLNRENDVTQPAYSLFLAAEEFEPTIVVDGDVVFRKEIIKDLLLDERANILVSRAGKSVSEKGGKLIFRNGCLKRAGVNLPDDSFPWYIYSGIMKIDGPCLGDSVKLAENRKQSDLLDILFLLCDRHKIANLLEFEVKDERMLGGSGASIEKRLVVRKEAPKGNWKLEGQIRWLLRVPKNLKRYFPDILCHDLKSDPIWYEMPFYDIPSLRKLLLTGEVSPDEAIDFLCRVVKFMFDEVYSRNIKKVSKWVEDKHIKRVETRLAETASRAPLFRKIFGAHAIKLNNRLYENVPSLLWKIKHAPELISDLQPEFISMVHGDLHFQNIIWDRVADRFILTDPRGDVDGSDFAYDLGKLWHCFDGLYDFMHEDLFVLKNLRFLANTFCADLVFTHTSGVKAYGEIKDKFPQRVAPIVSEVDENWLMRAEFNNACHLSSVMPFHIKGDDREHRAIALYLTGVRLMNDFIDKHGEKYGFYKEKEMWINVNTPEDYEEARRWSE